MTADGDRPIRVLHVEDDPAFADVASATLEREHPAIEVETAGDAEAALEALDSAPVDCVVSDYEMPGADGLELLDAVRERHGDLPFVLFTGKGSEEIASEAISAGVTDYLQKGRGNEQFEILANRIENAVARRRTAAALEAERRRFELVGRASTDAIWDWDLRTGEIDRSEGYERLFGFDEAAVGDDLDWWLERVHPEDREDARRALREALEGDAETVEFDYRLETADGVYRDARTRAVILRDDGGEPVRVVGAVTDVTDRRRREGELEAARSRLALVLEGTDTGVWEWDPGSGTISWDSTVERLFCSDGGGFDGTYEGFLERVHDDDRHRVDAAVADALETGERYDVEFRIERGDGAVRWCRAKGIPPADGGPDRFVGLIDDVTERKERELAFEQYETILQTVPDGIFVLDEEATIVAGNETAATMLGFEREALVGTPFEALIEAGVVDPSIVDRYEDAVRRLLSSETDDEQARYEYDVTVDGEDRVYEGRMALRPFEDAFRGTIGVIRDVTAQKERERELERYETLLDLLPDTVTVTDTDGRLLEIHGFEGWSGYDTEEIVGTHITELMPPEDVERADAIASELIRDDEREKATFEMRVRTKAGELVPFENHLTLLPPEEDGLVPGSMSVLRDISERKEREERLRRSERRFEAVFDDPTAFIGLLEPDGTLALVNETALSFVGASLEDVTGRHFVDTPWWAEETPEKRAEIEAGIERAADGEFVRFEATHAGVDGETIGVEGHIRPVTDASGEVVSLLVEGIDVTDRLEHERRIEGLHETTRELVRADDAAGVADVIVGGAEEVLGFPMTVVRIREGDELHPVAVSDGARAKLGDRPVYAIDEGMPGRAYRRGEPLVLDERDERAASHPWSHHARLYVPIGDHGTLSIGTDRPASFDASDVALAQLLTDNAAVALDRIEGEGALRRRERALRRQNERLDRFASIVSHDLRNPLTVARGHLEMIDAGPDDEHVERVSSAIARIEEIVEDVLSLARGGEGTVDPDPTDLRRAVEVAWATIDAPGASLEAADDLGTCPADESRLRQLLENLFQNAVEHSDGDVTVRVGRLEDQGTVPTGGGDDPSTQAVEYTCGFFVEDDGPGIPAEERDHVFEFGRSGSGDGTGYGLAIVEEIAEAHGWEVVATEGERGGARFEVRDAEPA